MMPIGEIARRAGLRPSAIRYYERLGLLPPAVRASGRRRYDDATVARLEVIRFARANGFTLREIGTLLSGRPYSSAMRDLARAKIRSLEQLIEQARGMQSVLRGALRCRCLNVVECGRRLSRNGQER